MSKECILSVCVVTYGQEKYIGQALDSILAQKTKYDFEILVAEDCSPDNTRHILKDYEKKYPNRFKMLYLDENTYNTTNNAFVRLSHMAKGKYVIILEGDDYWIDPLKLEKQISYLEAHPDYIAVAHNCLVVGDDSQPLDEEYPECKDEEYTDVHWYNDVLPGQTATVMYRNPFFIGLDWSIMEKALSPGDRIQFFVLVASGKIHCIQEKMSAYRHVTTKGSSFSANLMYDFEKMDHWYAELIEWAKNNATDHQVECLELIRFMEVRRGINAGKLSKSMLYKVSYHHSYIRLFYLYLKRWYRSHILHDKFRVQ
ncbi:glycosyltransferase [Selenomonas ruminis]|uniref:Glycosyltransferase n=1 Tax=Selenomonas ruminis TaxID=2593411 RepID=A0A5D6WBV2_9FIRM|nr:glycosyltransferase [Selenomonas sp. mPRGC5]TYZ24064.1 glycosyltransferase [Selenomonas sp. mPRGC5]